MRTIFFIISSAALSCLFCKQYDLLSDAAVIAPNEAAASNGYVCKSHNIAGQIRKDRAVCRNLVNSGLGFVQGLLGDVCSQHPSVPLVGLGTKEIF